VTSELTKPAPQRQSSWEGTEDHGLAGYPQSRGTLTRLATASDIADSLMSARL
jgi:hypothetical protein